MSSAFLTLKNSFVRPAIIAQRKDGKALLNALSLNGALLLTLLLVSVLYLVHVNTLATKGYTIKELQKRIAQEKREQESLQMKSIEAGSLTAVEAKLGNLKMVRTEKIEYLTPTVTALR